MRKLLSLLIALFTCAALAQQPAVSVRNGTTLPIICQPSSLNIFLHRTSATAADTLYICTDGALGTWTAVGGGGVGTGDFVGPGAATDNAVVRFDGTTGKLGQNSVVTIGDAGEVAGAKYVDLNGGSGLFRISTSATGFSIFDFADSAQGVSLSLAGLTSSHTITVPDADGTLAFTTSTVAKATALAANGTDCSSGSAPIGVDASGNVETCQALPTNTTSAASNWFSAYNSTTGVFTKSRPACADLSNAAATCSSAAESVLAFTDITTNNASTANHGFLKKLDNNAAHFMDGTGNWTTPSSGAACSTCTPNVLQKGNGASTLQDSGLTETASGTLRSVAGTPLDLATAMQTSDAVTVNTLLTGEWAYGLASTNTGAGPLILSGGVGTRKYTIVTFGSTGGKTITVTTWAGSGTTGTATTLTEGVDWTCVGTSNNTCASNLATAINANGTLGSKVTATASSAVVSVERKAGGNLFDLTIATNAGAPLTATSGNNGSVRYPNGSSTVPAWSYIGAASNWGWGYDTGSAANVFWSGGATQMTLGQGGGVITLQTGGNLRWADSTDPVNNSAGTNISKIALGVVGFGTGAGGSGAGWFNYGGTSRVKTSDVTNATATPAAITGMTSTVAAGRFYSGYITVWCNNSAAAEGIQFDFNGGTATMTSFHASAGIDASGGTDVVGTNTSTALATALTFTTLTGETGITMKVSFKVNAAGTFIPRFAEATTATGTATVRVDSFMILTDTN